MIAIVAASMSSVQGGGSAADEDGARHQSLQVPLRGQEPLPLREIVEGHTLIVGPVEQGSDVLVERSDSWKLTMFRGGAWG